MIAMVVKTHPSGWASATVETFCDVVGGGTPLTHKSEYWNGPIPWITSADIHGIKDIRPRKQINDHAIKGSATNLLPSDSIIVVTRVGLGKVALVTEPLCFSQDSQGLVFDGMRTNAEQLGGRLIVESGAGGGGTTIACVVPCETDQADQRGG